MGLQRGEDSTLSQVEEVTVNDGDWHHVQMELKDIPGGEPRHKAVLSFDHGLYTVRHCWKTDCRFGILITFK